MIYICRFTIVRLPHPRSEDSHGQETFLAPSANKQTRNYDTVLKYKIFYNICIIQYKI